MIMKHPGKNLIVMMAALLLSAALYGCGQDAESSAPEAET